MSDENIRIPQNLTITNNQNDAAEPIVLKVTDAMGIVRNLLPGDSSGFDLAVLPYTVEKAE